MVVTPFCIGASQCVNCRGDIIVDPPPSTQKRKWKKWHPFCQGMGLTANKATCAGSHTDKDRDAGTESKPHPLPQPVLVQTEIASRQFCCQLEILSLLVDWKHHMVKCFFMVLMWVMAHLAGRDRPIFKQLLCNPTFIQKHTQTYTHTRAHTHVRETAHVHFSISESVSGRVRARSRFIFFFAAFNWFDFFQYLSFSSFAICLFKFLFIWLHFFLNEFEIPCVLVATAKPGNCKILH